MSIKNKSILIAVILLVGGLLTVLAPGFADYAKTPAAWTMWDILTVVGAASFIGAVVWLYKLSHGKTNK